MALAVVFDKLCRFADPSTLPLQAAAKPVGLRHGEGHRAGQTKGPRFVVLDELAVDEVHDGRVHARHFIEQAGVGLAEG